MLCIELSELPDLFKPFICWSARWPALAWFRRKDHLGDASRPLSDCVRDLVERRTGERPLGPIRLLTHLRYLGYCMNPVSFYYCFDCLGERVTHVVAEVHNTPWGEQYCYVLSYPEDRQGLDHLFRFQKAFHVSPFMPMKQNYEWALSAPRDVLQIHMSSLEETERVFSADLSLQRTPINHWTLAKVLVSYPLMTVKVLLAIYWEALRLWMGGVRFYNHPEKLQQNERG